MRPRRRPGKRWTPRPGLQWVLDRFTAPAIVRNGRMDLLAVNHLGRAMHAALYGSADRGQPNFARFTFLDLDAARDFYPDWEGAADTCVSILRTEAGRDPHDKELHDLVGELSTRSDHFRRRWSAHNVRYHGAGTKRFHHRDVGDLELAYESVDMISDPGLTLTLYAAEPGSSTAHALDLLASWTAVADTTNTTADAHQNAIGQPAAGHRSGHGSSEKRTAAAGKDRNETGRRPERPASTTPGHDPLEEIQRPWPIPAPDRSAT